MTDVRPMPPELVTFVANVRKAGACRIALRQYVAGAGDTHVTAFEIGALNDREIAEELWKRATRDAAAFGSVTTYFACAFKSANDSDTYFDRYPFRIAGKPIDGLRPTEEPNAVGLVAQSMRHSEAMALQYTEATAEALASLNGIIETQRKIIAQQGDTIATLSKGQLDVIELRERLLTEEHTRQLETKRSEAEERRQEWAIQQLGGVLLPLIQQKLLAPKVPTKPNGKAAPGVPSAAAAAEAELFAAVDQLMANLMGDKESQARIWNVLTPEQQAILTEVFRAANARARAYEHAAHANGAAGPAAAGGTS